MAGDGGDNISAVNGDDKCNVSGVSIKMVTVM